MSITGMNHAVLYVRSAERTASFYEDVLDFVRVIDDPQGRYVFMRAPKSENHHDLALFTVGDAAGEPTRGGNVGLYHIAWEVPTLDDLESMRQRLLEAGALAGESDHAVNKSLYARDPDGIEFEVMWLTPPDAWGSQEHEAIIAPLNLEKDRQQFGSASTLLRAVRERQGG